MTPEDRRILGHALAAAAEIYEREVSKAQMEIWAMLIDEDGLAATAVAAAIKDHIKSCRFFPRPAEIRERLIPKREPKADALLAWTQVLDSFTGGQLPEDAATQFAIRAVGGLQAIGHYPTHKLEWLKKDFVEAYETAADRHNGALIGHDERRLLT